MNFLIERNSTVDTVENLCEISDSLHFIASNPGNCVVVFKHMLVLGDHYPSLLFAQVNLAVSVA